MLIGGKSGYLLCLVNHIGGEAFIFCGTEGALCLFYLGMFYSSRTVWRIFLGAIGIPLLANHVFYMIEMVLVCLFLGFILTLSPGLG